MSDILRTSQYADPKGTIAEGPVPNTTIISQWDGVPTASQSGHHVGALAFDRTNGNWYRNTGSATSATWTRQTGTITAETITTLTTSTISGGGSTIAITDRATTTDGVSSGTARVIGGLAYSSVAASTAITGSTATEQLFDSNYTIPANTLKAGTVVKCRVQAIATGTTSTDTLAYKLYIGGSGGTALVSAAATDATNNDTFQAEFTLVCRTAGTTGTFVSTGSYKVTSAEGTYTIKDDITASTTINTTANQAVVVTGTWSVANATNTCRVDIMTVEIT